MREREMRPRRVELSLLNPQWEEDDTPAALRLLFARELEASASIRKAASEGRSERVYDDIVHLATTHRLPGPTYALFTHPLLLPLVTLSVCRTF